MGAFQVMILLYYRTAPMFYVPSGWMGPFAYILCLPFAPFGMLLRVVDVYFWFILRITCVGSVGVVFWLQACKNVAKRAINGIAPQRSKLAESS
jgi:hypothetical protein